ncbi:MAG: rRNA maturation RNase YbeY [Clostridia bacterium]|nr:rRNA maturation RNase YbeY [Clostridia bacterium]
MIVEFFCAPSVNGSYAEAETDEAVDTGGAPEKKENFLVSDEELSGYRETVEKVLSAAENRFPDFAADTGTTVNVYLVDNEMIRGMNKEQRGIDRETDVLSFPFLDLREGDGDIDEYDLNPENGAIMLGEIVVSVEKMKEQALEYGHGESRELAFLVCHGFLHLMGYDHEEKDDEAKMFPLTESILNEAGYGR